MARKRIHSDNAARQKAYRKRFLSKYHVSEWRVRFSRIVSETAEYLGRKDEIEEKLISGELTTTEAANLLRDHLAVRIAKQQIVT
jgi:hypothetical protein